MTHRVLVIGLGSNDRGEDVAGLLVAHRVRRACGGSADVIELDSTACDLTQRWGGAQTVVVVEATPGEHPGAVRRYEVNHATVPAGLPEHARFPHLEPAIRHAQRLGALPERMTIYAIEAERFRREAGVSPDVARAAGRVAAEIIGRVTADIHTGSR